MTDYEMSADAGSYNIASPAVCPLHNRPFELGSGKAFCSLPGAVECDFRKGYGPQSPNISVEKQHVLAEIWEVKLGPDLPTADS